jgi:peroxiredoxin
MMRLNALLVLVMMAAAPAIAQKKAPDFSFKTQYGKDFQLSRMKGKVVLINFWATWCGPCRAEIPGFLQVYERYKDKGLEIVGISLDENGWEVVTPFIKRFNITYPIVIDARGVVAQQYGRIDAIPTSFFIDRKGNIVDQHVGYLSKEELEKKIKSLL